MTDSTDKTTSTKAFARSDSVSGLEADIAFIEASQALLAHQPDTIYRDAQQRTYESLKTQLENRLQLLRERLESHQQQSSKNSD